MPRSLRVTVNRDGHQQVDARTKRFAADGPFVLAVDNRGEGCHVHLSASGDLALDADLPDDNPFVPAGETLEVPVDVVSDLRPATGTVTVTTGYGRNEASVDVRVGGEAAADDGVGAHPGPTHDPDAGADGGVADAVVGGVHATVARVLSPLRRTDSVDGGDEEEAAEGPTAVERIRPPAPDELGPGALVLLALSVLALFVALLAHATFRSPVVTAAVVTVLAAVLGSGFYLLVR